jgi:hypothetical protein
VLIDSAVPVPPHAGDLRIRNVHEPPVASTASTRAGSVDQQRSEPLHPTEQRHVINFDAALGKRLLEVPIRQAVAEVPTHGELDDLGREPKPRER